MHGPDVTVEGWVLYTFDARNADPERMTAAVAGRPPDGAGVPPADLQAWSTAKLARELAGEQDAHITSTERVRLPLGPAIRYSVSLRNARGTFHLVLFHIWTPYGVVHFSAGAYDGNWARDERDFSIMPWTLRLMAGPARTGSS